MIAKITLYNGVVYKIGDKTQDTSDGLYAGRIVDELQIESKMSDKGATPLSLNITIRNDDNFIPNTVDLWAATIELTATNGNKWVGKINFFDFDADGNVYVTASEKTAPELELQLPDEVRQVYTVDNNFHPSSTSMTIPLVVGGTASAPITLSTILIDKQNGVYLIGTGEIRQILKVYNGSEELPASAYTAYTGTASQSEHAGFAYVKINEAYRKNADGTYAEINVDVIGLKLSSYNAEECRNPARFLYYFLTTPSSGVNGWGCGISASDIDSASFNSAITLCDTLGYKLDGIMWLRQSAQSWIDQICQTMHASYTIGANGKRTLFIDYAGAASKRTFTENDCKVSRYGKNSYSGQVYNKGVLSYGYNPITGLFMQSAQFEDSASVSQIGEQKFVGESYLIGDASTALKVLEYTCKRSLISAEAIEFETDRLETLLKAGDLITLNFPSRNINAVYQIANISTSEYKSTISAVKFDTSVFTVSGSKTNVAWGKDRDITPALTPAQATNLLLSTGFDINPDGTGIPYISGTYDVPAGGWIAAAVQYGVGVNPTNYTELALITEGRFKIQPVSVGTVYTVRIRMITATGHSDYITGQITSTGDTTPPAVPTIVVNATDKSVIVKCAIDNPPADMGGFQIWRKKHSESVFTLVGNVAANFGYASFSDYVDTFVQYDYKAKSYDRSGNLSDFSQVVSITPTGLEATELAATAIKIPTGSILNINAKGSTTESIKTANGVFDGSGYGHHGQAYGGVSVLDGGEGFSFNGTSNSYINLTNSMKSVFYGLKSVTFRSRVKFNNVSAQQGLICGAVTGNTAAIMLLIMNNGKLRFTYRLNSASDTAATVDSTVLETDREYDICATADFESGEMRVYLDGELNGSSTSTLTDTFNIATLSSFNIGRQGSTYHFNGVMRDVRIYPRALSATEVKSMYMLPKDVVLTRVTADLIGANAVNAVHINAGAITSEKIGAGEVKADNLAANAITAEKIAVGGRPNGCRYWISAQGVPNADANTLIPDLSGCNSTFKFLDVYGSIYHNDSQYNRGWFFHASPSSGLARIVNTKSVAMTAASTFVINFRLDNLNAIQTLLEVRPNNSSANRLVIRIETSGKIRIYSSDADAANWENVTTTLAVTAESWHTLIVVINGANITARLTTLRNLTGNLQTWTGTLAHARAAFTAGAGTIYYGSQHDNYPITGYINNMQYFPYAMPINYVYYLISCGNDTDIGSISADRIVANAVTSDKIAANAITAEKLAVTTGLPSGIYFRLGICGMTSYEADTPVPDLGGYDYGFVLKGTWSSVFASTAQGWMMDGRNSSTHYICNTKSITIPASVWTMHFKFYADLTNGATTYQYLLQARKSGSDNAQRLEIRIRKSDGIIQLISYNADATAQTVTTSLAVSTNEYYSLVVRCTSTTNIYIYLARANTPSDVDADGNTATCTLTSARAAMTCSETYLCFGANRSTSVLYGIIGSIMMFYRSINANEIRQLIRIEAGLSSDSGTITADRIATDAIKSRNYDGTTVDNHFSKNGTFHDLANGYCKSRFIAWDGAGAYINGYVKATGGAIGDYFINDGGLHRSNSASGTSSISKLLFDISNTANYTNCVNILSTGNSNNGVYVSISGNTEATSYGVNSLAGSANSIAGYFHKSVADANNPVLYVTAANSTSLALSVIGKAICSSGTWSGSDRNIKSQIKSESVLNRLKQIEITSWKYNQDKIDTIENEKHKDDEKYEKVKRSKQLGATNQPKHFGAMAEEFNSIFGTSDGASDVLCYTDTIGVALRAIQELSVQLDDLKREVRLYKRILNISQEQINTERDNTANRKLAIAQYRQAKHEARLAQEPQEEMRPAT